jgi:Predicted membrane protein
VPVSDWKAVHRGKVVGTSNFTWLFFSISGRISRWVYFLATMLLSVIAVIPLYKSMIAPLGSAEYEMWNMIFALVFLGSLWPHVALSVKRFHDFNREGYFAVTLFIPVLSILAFLILCLYPGDPGANRYGRYTNAPQD